MFHSYDVDDLYDDDLTIPHLPAFWFVPSTSKTEAAPTQVDSTSAKAEPIFPDVSPRIPKVSPNLSKVSPFSRAYQPSPKIPPPKRPALVPLSQAYGSPQEDFPFLLHDRVRVMLPRHEFTGRVGVITSFVRSIYPSRELLCCVFFSCGTTLGIPVSQLEFDPRSQLLSNSLLDQVVRQARMPQPKA